MLISKQMSMQETDLSLSQIVVLSDGYSIREVWDGPYSHYPRGSPLKELWPLCSWRLEESVFFQLFTTLLPYAAKSANLFTKEKQPFPFYPIPPLICPVQVYFWRRGLVSSLKQSFLAAATQALWSYHGLTLLETLKCEKGHLDPMVMSRLKNTYVDQKGWVAEFCGFCLDFLFHLTCSVNRARTLKGIPDRKSQLGNDLKLLLAPHFKSEPFYCLQSSSCRSLSLCYY